MNIEIHCNTYYIINLKFEVFFACLVMPNPGPYLPYKEACGTSPKKE